MRKIIIFCTFALFALAACQTITKSAVGQEAGQYKGPIESITSPIVMQYRPFPKSTFKRKTEKYLVTNGHKKLVSSSIERGTISATRHGAGVVINYSVTKPKMTIKITVTEFGVLKDFKMDAPHLNLSMSRHKIVEENFKNFFKSIITEYPKKGLIDGDEMNASADLASFIRGITPDTDDVSDSMEGTCTVTGTTQYNNRQVLVTDGDSIFNVKVKMSSIGFQLSGSAHGYSFVDIATGVLVYSESLTDMHRTIGKDTNMLQIVETVQIGLK